MKSIFLLLIIFSFQAKCTLFSQSDNNEMLNYSVTIEIFRKGTYKIYSLQLKNGKFEAVKYTTNDDEPQIFLANKILSIEEAKDFKNFILEFPIDSLQKEYVNNMVKGEHHLIFKIKIDEKFKEIYVYFEEQQDLKELYKRIIELLPVEKRFWYY